MGNNNGTGLKFFSELYGFDYLSDVLVAFSFTNQPIGQPMPFGYIYPDTWAINSATGLLSGDNTFFTYSGTGFFNSKSVITLDRPLSLLRTAPNEIDFSSTILFSYEKLRHGDEILISSFGESSSPVYSQSGFCVGVNDANKLYFKYWNDIEGPFSFVLNKTIANKNLVAIQNQRSSIISLGVFNNNTKSFEFENFEIYREVFKDSKNISIGGITGRKPSWLGTGVQNFSGYIDNFYFLRDVDQLKLNYLTSGLIYDPPNEIPGFSTQECFTEEFISGSGYLSFEQTGIEFKSYTGYITGVTGSATGLSGLFSTGVTGYLKILIGSYIDRCGETINIYETESLTGTIVTQIPYSIDLTGLIEITGWGEFGLSGFVERFTDVTIYVETCTNRIILTGNVNYNIQTGFLTSLSYDYITLLSQINSSNDKIEIFTENFQPINLKYNIDLAYDQVKENYYLLDKPYNQNEFLLWANGQALINSGFDSVKDGYDEFQIPKVDYFVNEREIETTDIYKEFNNFLFYDNISGNYWALKTTGNVFSLPINLTDNYWIFKNGQKLIEGNDYNNLLKQKLTGDSAFDIFGQSVATNSDGTVLVMGGWGDGDGGNAAGAALVYTGSATAGWQLRQKLTGDSAGDTFGQSVATNSDGTVLVMGGYLDDDGGDAAGAALVYTGNAVAGWQLRQKLTGDSAGDRFGWSVATNSDGTLLMMGGYLDDDGGGNAGAALVYTGNAVAGWQLRQKLKGDSSFDTFGQSVATNSDGTVLVMGGREDDDGGTDAGAALVYTGNAVAGWQLRQKLRGDSADDQFGQSVATNSDGTVLMMGGYLDDDGGGNAGAALVYTGNAVAGWQLRQKLTGDSAGDQFGWSVATNSDGTLLMMGGYLDDDGGTNAGAALVYNFNNIISITNNNETGENYYIIKEIPDNFIYHSGNSGSLKLTGTFNHGCSQVYFNGIKQKINNNYFENSNFDLISGSFFNNTILNNIYNNTNDWWFNI